MKRILVVAGVLLLLFGSATAGLCADVEIFYSVHDLGVDPNPAHNGLELWEYDYTVANHSLTGNDKGVLAFNVYFPDGGWTIQKGTGPADWRTQLVNGIYCATGDADMWYDSTGYPHINYAPIHLSQTLDGFSVTFDYLGPPGTSPGPQSFDVMDMSSWQPVDGGSGTTELDSTSVPEPLSLCMLGIGLIGLGVVRKKGLR